jgi:hypothetical protein
MPIAKSHAAIKLEKRQRPRRIVMKGKTTDTKDCKRLPSLPERKPTKAIIMPYILNWAFVLSGLLEMVGGERIELPAGPV